MNNDAQIPGHSSAMTTNAAARRLLRVGLTTSTGSFQDLLESLPEADRAEWIMRAIAQVGGRGDCFAAQIEGVGGIEAMEELKRRAKSAMSRAESPEARARASVVYFLALAAALARHGKWISARSWDEARPALEDLGALAPEPWRFLVNQSIARASNDALDRERPNE